MIHFSSNDEPENVYNLKMMMFCRPYAISLPVNPCRCRRSQMLRRTSRFHPTIFWVPRSLGSRPSFSLDWHFRGRTSARTAFSQLVTHSRTGHSNTRRRLFVSAPPRSLRIRPCVVPLTWQRFARLCGCPGWRTDASSPLSRRVSFCSRQ